MPMADGPTLSFSLADRKDKLYIKIKAGLQGLQFASNPPNLLTSATI